MLKKVAIIIILFLANGATATSTSTPRISLIPRTISVDGGVRTVFGDDRNFALGIADADGGWERHELTPVKGAIGGALAFTLDGSLGKPLSYGFDLDLGFGEMTIFGVGFGVGYNIPLALDDAESYIQLKLNASYAMTHTDFGELPIDDVTHDGNVVGNPKLGLAGDYIILRPEVNYFRYLSSVRSFSFVDGFYLRASFGFKIPISEIREPRLSFSNDDGDEFSVSVSGDEFALFGADENGGDWNRVEKTDISPLGVVASIGFTFEF